MHDKANSTSTFYYSGGTMPAGAPSYVKRMSDERLFEALSSGEFTYILTPRQQGKSSVMVHVARRLKSEGVSVAAIDLSALGFNLDAKFWYRGLLTQLGRRLNLEDQVDEFCDRNAHLSPLQQWQAALSEILLRNISGKIVIFLDEIDITRALPFSTDELFAAIRYCYNERAMDPSFNRLTFCLLGVASPNQLIQNPKLTPFNIGRRIDLADFTRAECLSLRDGLGKSPAQNLYIFERILYWTGGHPYLTQRLCEAVSKDADANSMYDVDGICWKVYFSPDAELRDDNLSYVQKRLLEQEQDIANIESAESHRASLLTLYDRILRGKRVPDSEADPLAQALKLSGVVRSEDGYLRSRNPIYRQVFSRKWIRDHMPDAELRRQRRAYIQGIARTSAIAAVVMIVLTTLTFTALKQYREASKNLIDAYIANAKAIQISGRIGQKFDSLDLLVIATKLGPDKTQVQAIRDAAITSLSLPVDLRLVRKEIRHSDGSGVVAFDMNHDRYYVADAIGNITIKQLKTDSDIAVIPGEGQPVVFMGRHSPDGRFISVFYAPNERHDGAIANGTIHSKIWDVEKRRIIVRSRSGLLPIRLDFSQDNNWLGYCEEGIIAIIDLRDGTTHSKTPVSGKPELLRISPYSQRIAIRYDESQRYIEIRTINGDLVQTIHTPKGVYDISWNGDGSSFCFSSEDDCVYSVNLATGRIERKMEGHKNKPLTIAHAHNSDLLVSAGWDNMLRCWNVASGNSLLILPLTFADTMEFTRDDSWLQTANTMECNLYAVDSAPACYTLRTNASHNPCGLAFSEGSVMMASVAGGDGPDSPRLWDTSNGRLAGILPVSQAGRSVAFNDDNSLITYGETGLLSWPIQERPPAGKMLIGSPHRITGKGLASDVFALDRKRQAIAVIARDREGIPDHINAASLPSGNPISKIGNLYGISGVVVSPDGKLVAAGRWQTNGVRESDFLNGVCVWERESRRLITRLPVKGHTTVCFSGDGKWLVTGSDQQYDFWRTTDWRRLHSVERRIGSISSCAASASEDGQLIALSLSNTEIQLRRVSDLAVIATIEDGSGSSISNLSLSPDSRFLAVFYGDHIKLWDFGKIRPWLSQHGIDWDVPPLQAPEEQSRHPLRVIMDTEKIKEALIKIQQESKDR